MNKNALRYMLIGACLLLAATWTSCGKGRPAKPKGGDSKTKTDPRGLIERETVVKSGELELKAVVKVPARPGGKLVPGAVIVHTFAHTNLDGTITVGERNISPYRDLAERLAGAGIASVRYDKRTLPPYVPKFNVREFTLDYYIQDAKAAFELLRATEGVDPGRLYFIGHGQGAVVVPALVEADPELAVRGLVLIAPPMMPADELVIRQHQFEIYQISLAIKFNPGLEETFGPRRDAMQEGMQKYMAAFGQLHEGGQGWDKNLVLDGHFEKYWRHATEIFGGNVERIKASRAPVLIVQGNLDRLVIAADLLKHEQEFDESGRVTIELLDYIGHHLIDPKTAHIRTDAADAITGWILNTPKPPAPPESDSF